MKTYNIIEVMALPNNTKVKDESGLEYTVKYDKMGKVKYIYNYEEKRLIITDIWTNTIFTRKTKEYF